MLLCGSGIYLLFRSKSLNIYKWCAAFGISDGIDSMRYAVSSWNLSEFVKFSLPDGLYSAAYVLIMDAIWKKESGCIKYTAILSVPLFAISNELLQYWGFVQGTFDYCDLVCYTTPLIIYLMHKKIKKIKKMKKYFISIVTIVLFFVGFTASSAEEKEANFKKRCGVYEVTDVDGCTLLFHLNEDKTLTANFKNNATTYYGYIDYYCDEELGMVVEFSESTPILHFQVGINDWSGFYFTPDDYLYPQDRDLVDAKNPRARLKAKKIK